MKKSGFPSDETSLRRLHTMSGRVMLDAAKGSSNKTSDLRIISPKSDFRWRTRI